MLTEHELYLGDPPGVAFFSSSDPRENRLIIGKLTDLHPEVVGMLYDGHDLTIHPITSTATRNLIMVTMTPEDSQDALIRRIKNNTSGFVHRQGKID